jgi:hypothetical protein
MLRRETLVCDTIEDETGIANLIVWAAILERFRRTARGSTLLRCTGKLQRRGERHSCRLPPRLDDLTSRLHTLRECGEIDPGRAPKSPFACSATPPGYDPATVCVTVAESGRGGEVRQIGVFENRPEILGKMAARLGKGGRRLSFCRVQTSRSAHRIGLVDRPLA